MPILTDYRQFSGAHPETGTIHNALAYQGVISPATGQPFRVTIRSSLSARATHLLPLIHCWHGYKSRQSARRQ